MIKKISIISFIALALWACTPKPLKIDLVQAPVKLAISTQIVPGQAIIVTVSKSFSALQQTDSNSLLSQFLVEHARVILTANGTDFKLTKIAPGIYGNLIGPNAPGTVFNLAVYDSTTGLSITSQTKYYETVSIDSLWFDRIILVDDTNYFANIRFVDPAGQNHYMINTYKNSDAFTRIDGSDILFDGNNGVRTTPVSDAIFTQALHTERVPLFNYKKGDTLTVTLSNISPDYYKYLVERNRARRNGLGTALGEPVTLTTNIVGGYSFFTAIIPNIRRKVITD